MRSSRLLDALRELHSVGGYVLQSVVARTSSSHLPDGRVEWCPAMGERVSQWGEGLLHRVEGSRSRGGGCGDRAGVRECAARRSGMRGQWGFCVRCDAWRHRRKAGRGAVSNKVVAKSRPHSGVRPGQACGVMRVTGNFAGRVGGRADPELVCAARDRRNWSLGSTLNQ